jgi:hypothetical protein
MKKFYLYLILFTSCLTVTAQNDCSEALVVCGNASYYGLGISGAGTQEIGPNVCSGQENNSVWLKVKIDQGGTLGFVLTPENASLTVDFDFWIFGPTAECGELGTAIRCSTTNPLQAGLSYNTGGINDIETDTSEGPGFNGNAFVKWLTVEDDEIYYIIVDRLIGSDSFSLEWTGTATFNGVYFENTGDDTVSYDMVKCDQDGVSDQSTSFDLTTYEETFIGDQENVAITYYLNANDMILGINPIENPESYSNISPVQPVYLRMTSSVTECFDEYTFNIIVTGTVTAGEPQDLWLCDDNGNGIGEFDLSQINDAVSGEMPGALISYHLTQEDAENNINAIGSLYENTMPYESETLWVRLANEMSECAGFDIKPFTVTVLALPHFNNPEDISLDLTECAQGENATFDLTLYEEMFTGEQDNILFSYYETMEDATNAANMIPIAASYTNVDNPQIIYSTATDAATGCFAITELHLIVNGVPEVIQPAPFLLCDYDPENPEQAAFDLTGTIPQIIPDQENMEAAFYYTQEDAEGAVNAIATPGDYLANPAQTIFVRVNNTQTGCYTIVVLEFDIVTPPTAETPQLYEDTAPVVVLYDTEVETLGTVTWYATEADAEAGINALPENTEVTESGTYYVTQTISECESAPFAVVFDILLGTGDFTANTFHYYPNPVQHVLTLSSGQSITSVKIFNMLGQEVLTNAAGENEVSIDMSFLPAGNYIVKASENDKLHIIRIIRN